MRTYVKDSNTKKIFLYMVDSTDHVTPETGATVAVKVSKNGGAFGAGGGSVAELEDGVYTYTPSANDVDTLGPIVFKATASGCDACIVEGLVVAYDPYDAVRAGLSALPAAAPGSNGGLPTTNGTKLNQTVDLTAGQEISADVTKICGVAQSATDLKDFADSGYDPATHKVQGVVLTDTCTANTDLVSAESIITALEASTGWTAGGTLTYAEVVKIIASAVAGKVIDKAGVAGAVQHLDVEDGVTAIFENIPSNTTSPYRDPTIL